MGVVEGGERGGSSGAARGLTQKLLADKHNEKYQAGWTEVPGTLVLPELYAIRPEFGIKHVSSRS